MHSGTCSNILNLGDNCDINSFDDKKHLKKVLLNLQGLLKMRSTTILKQLKVFNWSHSGSR